MRRGGQVEEEALLLCLIGVRIPGVGLASVPEHGAGLPAEGRRYDGVRRREAPQMGGGLLPEYRVIRKNRSKR